ncbi:MAG TPA: hypothetical protein VLZ75_14920 [Chitinophagales bacterium]|nr:hypothetical protein [Chitinophagales bacterium]
MLNRYKNKTSNKLSLYFNVIVFAIISLFIFSCNSNNLGLESNNDELGFSKLDSITLQLEQIKVLFPTVEQWEESGAIRFTKDSAIISDRNGEMLLEKTFTINIDATKEIIVDQQYENILTIITSGDNIDLTSLNRYTSPWKIIEVSSSNKYSKKAYTIDEIKSFPSTSIQDVLDYIFLQTRTTQSEFDWNKYLKQSKSINEFPFDIKVSKITIRLRGEYLNGEPFKKYIVFNIK